MTNALKIVGLALLSLALGCGEETSEDCLAAIECAGFIDTNFGSETQSEAEALFNDPSCWETDQAADACSLACVQFRLDSQALIDQSAVEDTGICNDAG